MCDMLLCYYIRRCHSSVTHDVCHVACNYIRWRHSRVTHNVGHVALRLHSVAPQ
jgi:hypothetical protein